MTVVGRMTGGEGPGAYEVRTREGARAVLKFATGPHLDFEQAARTCEVLRGRGYPAPATLRTGMLDDTRFAVIELLPGEPGAQPAPAHVERIIELVELQRDAGISGRPPWIADIVSSVTEGRDGYCEHAGMRAYSPETSTLLDRLCAVAESGRDVEVPTDDVVHMDLGPHNTLVDGDCITGVIDWEGSTTGDAAFDLVTYAFYTLDVGLRDTLLDAARARTDVRALPVYAAHMTLRQTDWSIRFHDPAAVAWSIGIGTALLAAVGAR